MTRVGPRAVVLLDDADRYHANDGESDSDEDRLVAADLMHVLDARRADGWLFILTANEPEKLCPALLRSGRIDRTFTIGLATKDQATRLHQRLAGGTQAESEDFGAENVGRSMSDLQGDLLTPQKVPTPDDQRSDP